MYAKSQDTVEMVQVKAGVSPSIILVRHLSVNTLTLQIELQKKKEIWMEILKRIVLG